MDSRVQLAGLSVYGKTMASTINKIWDNILNWSYTSSLTICIQFGQCVRLHILLRRWRWGEQIGNHQISPLWLIATIADGTRRHNGNSQLFITRFCNLIIIYSFHLARTKHRDGEDGHYMLKLRQKNWTQWTWFLHLRNEIFSEYFSIALDEGDLINSFYCKDCNHG